MATLSSMPLYTCPMHPEVVRNGPGSCPICGMALEPRTVAVEEAPDPELLSMTRRLWGSLVFTVPVVFLGMSDMLPGGEWVRRQLSPSALAWVLVLAAAAVILVIFRTSGRWVYYEYDPERER